jgi:hypothetical protein
VAEARRFSSRVVGQGHGIVSLEHQRRIQFPRHPAVSPSTGFTSRRFWKSANTNWHEIESRRQSLAPDMSRWVSDTWYRAQVL